MTNREAFEIWAPAGSKWSGWVRPVPFVMNDCDRAKQGCVDKDIIVNDDFVQSNTNHNVSFEITDVFYVNELQKDTAIIVDRSGYRSINEGLALAKMGWRPIPLFNGTNEQYGAMALVDNHCIECALLWGAGIMRTLKFQEDAPPVFLLDSNRRHRYKMSVSVFDNSWDLFSQDIPTAEFFMSNGINNIVITGEKIHKDLRTIFYDFQKKGMSFFFTDGYDKPKEVRIKKPPRKSAF